MSQDQHTAPGVFEKGNLRRVADTPAEAAKFLFDGWSRVATTTDADEAPESPESSGALHIESDSSAYPFNHTEESS